MKSLLLTITPEILVNILNGKVSILVRKMFPKDYVGWVYLHCSKSNDDLWCLNQGAKNQTFKLYKDITSKDNDLFEEEWTCNNKLNGKVVARFWCDKVENVGRYNVFEYGTETITPDNFNRMTCLRDEQIREYLGNSKKLFAVHISKLEVFFKPKEISEFKKVGYLDKIKPIKVNPNLKDAYKSFEPIYNRQIEREYTLTKAPANYCYIDDFFFDNEEVKEPKSVLIDEKETDGFCG